MKVRDDAYNHGTAHPIFSQNLPEGFVRRYISEKLARYGKVMICIFWHLARAVTQDFVRRFIHKTVKREILTQQVTIFTIINI